MDVESGTALARPTERRAPLCLGGGAILTTLGKIGATLTTLGKTGAESGAILVTLGKTAAGGEATFAMLGKTAASEGATLGKVDSNDGCGCDGFNKEAYGGRRVPTVGDAVGKR